MNFLLDRKRLAKLLTFFVSDLDHCVVVSLFGVSTNLNRRAVESPRSRLFRVAATFEGEGALGVVQAALGLDELFSLG